MTSPVEGGDHRSGAPPEEQPPDRSPEKGSSAASFIALLESLGVTHVVTIPDNTSAVVLRRLAPSPIRVLPATREGEAIALASGLWLGGAVPVVLIQNTGLLESGDALRGTAARMGAPLLLLITCRGYEKARSMGVEPGRAELDRDALVRNDLDSAALMTEQSLTAWGIPFFRLLDPQDFAPVRQAWSQARWEERPVAVLVDTSFT